MFELCSLHQGAAVATGAGKDSGQVSGQVSDPLPCSSHLPATTEFLWLVLEFHVPFCLEKAVSAAKNIKLGFRPLKFFLKT